MGGQVIAKLGEGISEAAHQLVEIGHRLAIRGKRKEDSAVI
jgi:hypothetical protein